VVLPYKLVQGLLSVEVQMIIQGVLPFFHDILEPSEEHEDDRIMLLLLLR
jgi:hypothetical protein